jgi:hypothetical protein
MQEWLRHRIAFAARVANGGEQLQGARQEEQAEGEIEQQEDGIGGL